MRTVFADTFYFLALLSPSFVVMTKAGITEARTGDHHFEQAGFVALLK